MAWQTNGAGVTAPPTDLFYLRSLGTPGGYVFQTPGGGADIEAVAAGDLNAKDGTLKDPDRELGRLFRLIPDSTSTTVAHASSGRVLSDWSGQGQALEFGGPRGIGVAFSIRSRATDTMAVTLQAVGGAKPGDGELFAGMEFYAITRDDRRIPLVPSGEWTLVGNRSDTGPNTYVAGLNGSITPTQVGALVKIGVRSTSRRYNVALTEVQLRGRDLFKCHCTLHGVDDDPTVVRNASSVTTSETITFDGTGYPTMLPSVMAESLANVAKVRRLRNQFGTNGRGTLAWLQAGRELLQPLLLKTQEGPAFDDFLGCYAMLRGGPGNEHDFIGDFLGLNHTVGLVYSDVVAVFEDMAAAAPACRNTARQTGAEAYKTLKVELRQLVYQRSRVENLIEAASQVLKEKFQIAEESRSLFASLAAIQGDSPGLNAATDASAATLAGVELAAGVAPLIPPLSLPASLITEGATLIGDVESAALSREQSTDDVAVNIPAWQETSRNNLSAQIIAATVNARDALIAKEKVQQAHLQEVRQALLADIPMLAEAFPRVSEEFSVTGKRREVSEEGKWAIRGGVWKTLLPLKVALIGRPLVSFRSPYAENISPPNWAEEENCRDLQDGAATFLSQWNPALDLARYEYDRAGLDGYRGRFQRCFAAKTCGGEADAVLGAPDSGMDQSNYFFYSQTPPVRFSDFGVPAGARRVLTPVGLSRNPNLTYAYADGTVPIPPFKFIKSYEFWGWLLVNRPWNLAADTNPDNDRTSAFAAAPITVDDKPMAVREYAMHALGSPLDWYRAFMQSKQLYVSRMYRNSLIVPGTFKPLAGDSRPMYLSSVPLPAAGPIPTNGTLEGAGGERVFVRHGELRRRVAAGGGAD